MQVSVMAYSDLPDSIQTVFGICTLHTIMAILTVRAVIAVFGPKECSWCTLDGFNKQISFLFYTDEYFVYMSVSAWCVPGVL